MEDTNRKLIYDLIRIEQENEKASAMLLNKLDLKITYTFLITKLQLEHENEKLFKESEELGKRREERKNTVLKNNNH